MRVCKDLLHCSIIIKFKEFSKIQKRFFDFIETFLKLNFLMFLKVIFIYVWILHRKNKTSFVISCTWNTSQESFENLNRKTVFWLFILSKAKDQSNVFLHPLTESRDLNWAWSMVEEVVRSNSFPIGFVPGLKHINIPNLVKTSQKLQVAS